MKQLDIFAPRRTTVRTTSLEAYDTAKERASLLQATIYGLLVAHGPMTDERIGLLCDGIGSPSGIRTRRSELAKMGRVRRAGSATNSRGRSCIVWEAVR